MKKTRLVLTVASVCLQLASPRSVTAATPTCLGEASTIVGTEGDDQLLGTSGNDVIVGLGGDDYIAGLDRRDVLCGGTGRDVVIGGKGSDNLLGDEGADALRGSAGMDFFYPPSDEGRDSFDGGHGDDFLFFNKAEARVVVDLQQGFFRIGKREERIAPESFETVYGSPNADRILGDEEPNVLFGGFDSFGDTIRGRGGNDYLEGYESADVMRGGDGDDVFSGLFGGDVVDGGLGTDLVRLCGHFSGNGSVCGNGRPDPRPGATIDLVSGTITGGGSATLLSIENAEGTAYSDSIIGSDASNALYGGPGDDSISGGAGDDRLVGDVFAPLPAPLSSRLREGDISGPDGNDDLDGGEGTDSLDGGGGDDNCVNGEQVADCETQPAPSPSMDGTDWNVLLWPFLLVKALKDLRKSWFESRPLRTT
ncbi:MAG TPA: calcium-binding protein [Actinomycetota bacterium]|nr:calcium-binding protein [Actinomycetota bacterium]